MQNYRSLDAWKLAHRLAIDVSRSVDRHWRPRGAACFDQLRRAAISVPANIVEGYALGTSPQFARHLRIAIGSAAEAEYLVLLCMECDHLPETESDQFMQRADRLLAVLHGLLKKVRARR